MATAVQSAPHHLGVQQPIHYDYQNGLGPIGDEEVPRDADGNPLEEDMEAYYADREYHNQLHQQMLVQQAGMSYQSEEDEEDMYSDDSCTEESVLPDENIDFGLIYAL